MDISIYKEPVLQFEQLIYCDDWIAERRVPFTTRREGRVRVSVENNGILLEQSVHAHLYRQSDSLDLMPVTSLRVPINEMVANAGQYELVLHPTGTSYCWGSARWRLEFSP